MRRSTDPRPPAGQTLDYASPRDDAGGDPHGGPPVGATMPDSRRTLSTIRKIRIVIRVIYLVVCLALMYFVWRFVQGYKDMLENASTGW